MEKERIIGPGKGSRDHIIVMVSIVLRNMFAWGREKIMTAFCCSEETNVYSWYMLMLTSDYFLAFLSFLSNRSVSLSSHIHMLAWGREKIIANDPFWKSSSLFFFHLVFCLVEFSLDKILRKSQKDSFLSFVNSYHFDQNNHFDATVIGTFKVNI